VISSAHETKYDPSPKQTKEIILTLEIGNVLNRRLYNLVEIRSKRYNSCSGRYSAAIPFHTAHKSIHPSLCCKACTNASAPNLLVYAASSRRLLRQSPPISAPSNPKSSMTTSSLPSSHLRSPLRCRICWPPALSPLPGRAAASAWPEASTLLTAIISRSDHQLLGNKISFCTMFCIYFI